MLCDECRKDPATVHVTRIMNDQKTEMHLCAECARARGESAMSSEPGFAFHNILAGLFDPEGALHGSAPTKMAFRCQNCGMSLSDFRRSGKLGCSHCYEQFQRELEPLLRRIHRSVEHMGKRPPGVSSELSRRREIERLRERLQDAVRREAFEEAAKIRDQIRQLERLVSQPTQGEREGE